MRTAAQVEQSKCPLWIPPPMTMIIVLIMIGSAVLVAKAQDESCNNHIYLSSGLSRHSIQDEAISPFVYKGLTAPLWIQYRHYGTTYIHDIAAYCDRLDLTSTITNRHSPFSHYSDNINGQLHYGVLRKTRSIYSCNTDFYLGGAVRSFIHYRNHFYTNDDQAVTAEQNTCIDLRLLFYKKYNARNGAITYSLSCPLMSYALLADMYNANVNNQINHIDANKSLAAQFIQNGDFVFMNKLFEVQSALALHAAITPHMALGIEHYLQFYSFAKHPDNRPVKYVNHQFLIDLIIKLSDQR